MFKIRMPYSKRKVDTQIHVWALAVEKIFDRAVYKPPFKIKKQMWHDEYADSDLFTPSCPHLHSLDGKYKLNVYNGQIYNIRLKRIERNNHVSEDELRRLWDDIEFQKFATEMRKRYYLKFPDGKLPEIPFGA